MLPSATVEEREEGAFVAIYTMPMRMARNFRVNGGDGEAGNSL
jgi:hypothetical protein